MALVVFSTDSTDSYNRDDARRYLHEQDVALGHHWEATHEIECLEAALTASQTAPITVEGRVALPERDWLNLTPGLQVRSLEETIFLYHFAPLCSF